MSAGSFPAVFPTFLRQLATDCGEVGALGDISPPVDVRHGLAFGASEIPDVALAACTSDFSGADFGAYRQPEYPDLAPQQILASIVAIGTVADAGSKSACVGTVCYPGLYVVDLLAQCAAVEPSHILPLLEDLSKGDA